jgi:hypothetical protein
MFFPRRQVFLDTVLISAVRIQIPSIHQLECDKSPDGDSKKAIRRASYSKDFSGNGRNNPEGEFFSGDTAILTWSNQRNWKNSLTARLQPAPLSLKIQP